jgi:uncharacterized membrane protein
MMVVAAVMTAVVAVVVAGAYHSQWDRELKRRQPSLLHVSEKPIQCLHLSS